MVEIRQHLWNDRSIADTNDTQYLVAGHVVCAWGLIYPTAEIVQVLYPETWYLHMQDRQKTHRSILSPLSDVGFRTPQHAVLTERRNQNLQALKLTKFHKDKLFALTTSGVSEWWSSFYRTMEVKVRGLLRLRLQCSYTRLPATAMLPFMLGIDVQFYSQHGISAA